MENDQDQEQEQLFMEQFKRHEAMVKKEKEDRIIAIQSFDPGAMMDFLQDSFDQTDIILEGINMATQVSESTGMVMAGVLRLRSAVEAALLWIESHHADELATEEQPSADVPAVEPEKAQKKTKKTSKTKPEVAPDEEL